MKSDILGLILICLSDRVFEIITLSKSSVGNSIPMYKKLFTLDLDLLDQNLYSLLKKQELITI